VVCNTLTLLIKLHSSTVSFGGLYGGLTPSLEGTPCPIFTWGKLRNMLPIISSQATHCSTRYLRSGSLSGRDSLAPCDTVAIGNQSPLLKTCFHILHVQAFHQEEAHVGYLGKPSQWGSRKRCEGGVYVVGK